MEYEKKYNEAQKWIESIYSELSHEQQMEAEAFFPELKESEDVDKKIREEIIATIHLYYGKPLEDEAKEMIAWLEKQEGCEYIKKDWLEHIKQSWYKEGFIDGKYTPKEWTINDATTLNELIDFLENGTVKLQHDLTLYANWLKTQFSPIEKQGEQKDICGKCKKVQPYHSCQDITALGRCYIEGMNTANKDEPKFHEGEWITNGDYTWKIVEVKPLDYILQSQNGSIVDDTISHVDEQFHSFTIKDAKDGDVLAAHECVVLFKEIDGLNIKCYCTYHYIGFNPSFYVDTLQNKTAFQPATKEQRDTLLKAMTDAGWEFDFEKKELKKIESTNKVEPFDKYEGLTDFERTLADICTGWIGEEIGWKEYIKDNANVLLKIAIKKFNSVQDASFEQKSAWSEEDEVKINRIVDCLENLNVADNDILLKDVDWLKSLKYRYTWKPSDEQISVLSRSLKYINTISQNYCHVLGELLAQLKKLREE